MAPEHRSGLGGLVFGFGGGYRVVDPFWIEESAWQQHSSFSLRHIPLGVAD